MSLWEWLNTPLFKGKKDIKCSFCGHWNPPDALRCQGFLCNARVGGHGGGGMVE